MCIISKFAADNVMFLVLSEVKWNKLIIILLSGGDLFLGRFGF